MTQQQADVVIVGGLVATGEGIRRSDVVIADGRVREVLADASGVPARRTIDAPGRYVLPGAVDAHCHPVYTDKMEKMSLCAAYGGITTIVPFIGNVRSWGYTGHTVEIVKRFIEDGERTSYVDFGVHGAFTPADFDVYEDAIPQLAKMGITSYKMYLAYSRRGMLMPDEHLLRIMALAADTGGLAQVHAETGCCIDYLIDEFTAQGNVSADYFLAAQPNLLEVEAVTRSATFSAVTGSPLYPVHLSTREVPPVIRHFRELDKAPLYAETCPHYLTLTNEALLAQGPVAKCGPPLRAKEDNDALWEALADGTINVVASDSCGYTRAQKFTGGQSAGGTSGDVPETLDIFQASYGLNTIEFMVPVVWSHGVNTGRITLPRLVQVLCENPAKIFGLWPRKGSLAPGADADVVLWDPAKKHTVDRQHGDADFSSFERFELLGMPELVMQRGEVIIENDTLVRRPGQARFLAADPNQAPYAPHGSVVV